MQASHRRGGVFMFASVVIGIIVLIIAIIVYVEYKNEKTYQKERKRRSEERRKPKHPRRPEEKIQKPVQKKKTTGNRTKAPTPDAKKPVTPVVKKEENKTSPVKDDVLKPSEENKTSKEEIPSAAVEKKEKTYDLPACEYPKFDYSRLLKMGLSEEEAIEFIKELIPQLKVQIPLIKEAMDQKDFHSMEKLTHSIKGSSTTVGTGGVSDLLSEFNTYLKTGKDVPVAEVYFKHLNRYTDELEKQFA
jgi:cell division protein FtsI/penicillin-binding protein 2